MVLLDRHQRAALIARVGSGTTTVSDAQLLDRLLPGGARRQRVVLTDQEVVQMRSLWAHWRSTGVAHRRGPAGRGYGTLASAFGVAATTARDIVRGRTRRDAGGQIDE